MYQVAKKLQGAEKILLCMGYEPVPGSANEIQELKYGGEVNTWRVIDTAADLVILHSELDRIHDLVMGARQSNYINVTLRDILEARGEPNDTLASTLQRSLTYSLVRLRNSKQVQFPPAHLSQAPAIPPRGVAPQRQQSAQLKPPAMHGQPLSLEHQQDNQNLLPSGRRSSAPDVQAGGQSDHWRQPPPSPLLQQNLPPAQQPNMPIVPLNSKEKNNLDKTIDKSQGKGIDSAKYNVVPDTSSPVAKGASIPFDPSDLPDPAFDTHDLEMFHQEAYSTEDPYASSNMSLLINPRSDDFGDYSGPNLDDHLAYRSHDSGHMGLSESPADSASGKTAEEKNEQQLLDKEMEQEDTCRSSSHLVHMPGNAKEQHLLEKKLKQEDTMSCMSGSRLVPISSDVPSIKEANYSDVVLKEEGESPSSALFQVGDNTSIDSQPPSIYSQSTYQTAPPVPQPRSFSRREEERLSRHPSEGNLPTVTSSAAGCPCPPLPRPRSDNNLLSIKGSQGLGTPPSSPSRNKPTIAPRIARSRSNEPGPALGNAQIANRNVSAEDESAATATCVSQPLPLIHESLTIDNGATTTTSHATSMESNSSDNIHPEAHTSLDSGSPHPSLESKPSMSDKSDPCSSTPPEKAHSAYSGEKNLLVDVESSLGQDWVKVDLTVDKKDGKDSLSSLDSQPRPRERATAFSTKPDKTVSDKSQKAKPSKSTARDKAYVYVDIDTPIHTDIQSATPCWYCTNLTTLDKCDVCGNEQHRETI